MPEPHAVLAVYRFKKSTSLDAIKRLLREHERVLLAEKLRTPRQPWVLRSSADPRIFMEVFEWVDATAAGRAHRNPSVMALWGKFDKLAEKVGLKLADLAEAKESFPHFLSMAL